MTYITARSATLLSVALGIAGTAMLFFYSYSLQPYRSATMRDGSKPDLNIEIRASNRRWKLMQQIGFALLCASFLAQGVAVFLP